MNRLYYLLGIVVVILFVLANSIVIVDERQKVLVLRFGEVVNSYETPGLKFKVPFIDTIDVYDDRIQSLDMSPIEVTPLDDRRLDVDAFARYRIVDVQTVRRSVGGLGLPEVARLLNGILEDELRSVLGSVSSNDILSTDRATLMLRITRAAEERASELGITVIDVRLKQTNLPTENLQATFQRMNAEREREARDERARGEEAAESIRASADRTRIEIVSSAQREALIIRGQAEAERNRVLAEAYGADEEFFQFYRALAAYEVSLTAGGSRMVLSPDSDFFTYLQSDSPNGRVIPAPFDPAVLDDPVLPLDLDTQIEEIIPEEGGAPEEEAAPSEN